MISDLNDGNVGNWKREREKGSERRREREERERETEKQRNNYVEEWNSIEE